MNMSRIEEYNPGDGRTALHILADSPDLGRESSISQLKELLGDPRIDVNAIDAFGQTALHLACSHPFLPTYSKELMMGSRKSQGCYGINEGKSSWMVKQEEVVRFVETLLEGGKEDVTKCDRGGVFKSSVNINAIDKFKR